jgi:hypothetical protein
MVPAMDKKEYIAPSMEVVEFVSDILMNIGSNVGEYDEELDSKDQLSNKRRGQWGNLWAED